ncbi:MAG: pfkB [Herbinix sp.]|nr:pfkB [Herbinix sp.]
MIYTVTFNPSLDYAVWIKEFHLGNVHRAESEELYAGGKGINVSTVLKQLEVDNTALGFAAGFTGREILHRLNELEIPSDFILLKQGMSRINVKLKSIGPTETEVNGIGPVIEQKDLEELYQKLNCIKDGDYLVLSGSVPQSIKDLSNIYWNICKMVKTKKVKVVVDSEGDFLWNTLSERPFLIKPNHLELGMLFHKVLTTQEDIIDCAIRLQREGAVNVLVSMAGDGALLLDEYGNIVRQAAPKGEVVNSVGAGDSMVAGFLAGLIKPFSESKSHFTPQDYQYALKLAVASGSASAFSSAFPDRKMIDRIKQQMGF